MFAIAFHLPAWVLPVLLTVGCLCAMLRPYDQRGDYDFGMIFRLAWLGLIAAIWAVYFGVLLLLRG